MALRPKWVRRGSALASAAAAGVDRCQLPLEAAVRAGRTQPEAAVEVLHGPEDHVGDAREGSGDTMLEGMAPVVESSETKEAEPLASTPPPLPGAV